MNIDMTKLALAIKMAEDAVQTPSLPDKSLEKPQDWKGPLSDWLWKNYEIPRKNLGEKVINSPLGPTFQTLTGTEGKNEQPDYTTGPDIFRKHRGAVAENMFDYYAGEKGLNYAAFGAKHRLTPSPITDELTKTLSPGRNWFFARQTIPEATEGILKSRLRYALPGLGKAVPRLARMGSAIGGPWFAPLSVAFEGYDIAQHGYDLDKYRKTVTPDNTVLGAETHPVISYLGSAFNAASNPIRSSHLLYNDVKDLGFGENSIFNIHGQSAKLDEGMANVIGNLRNRLESKIRYSGYNSLTPGEKRDYQNYANPSYGKSKSVWENLFG